ncbi:MAG: hypothetical protein U0905_14875 [Pirellulales bacterium]
MPIQFRMVAICCGMAVSLVHSSLSRAQEFRPGHDAISALKEITSDRIASHIRFLSDDLLEGRGPASRGDQLTQAYVASQFQGMGLKPMESLGWFQKVPLVGVLTHAPQTMDWKLSEGSTKQESWKYFDEYIATAGKQEKSLAIEDSGSFCRVWDPSSGISMGRFQRCRSSREDFTDDEQRSLGGSKVRRETSTYYGGGITSTKAQQGKELLGRSLFIRPNRQAIPSKSFKRRGRVKSLNLKVRVALD